MKIRAAVLDVRGVERPYKDTQPLQIEELDLDPPGDSEVLVEIKASGLCHSDLSVIDGNRPRPTPMACLLYTSPSPRDGLLSRMPSSA